MEFRLKTMKHMEVYVKKLTMTALVGALSVGATAGVEVEHYGFVKADYLSSKNVSSKAASAGNDGNANKPFYAAEKWNKDKLDDANQVQLSLRDSRFGFKVSNGENTTAVFEFDFNGSASNISGAAAGTLRHRKAAIHHKMGNGELVFGKDWSQLAGLNPHTYAVTTVNLSAGNTGFLTDLIRYKHNFGNLAVGFESTSNGDVDTAGNASGAALVSSPNMGLRVDYKMGAHHFGFAHKTGTAQHKKGGDTGATKDAPYSLSKVFYHGNYGATDVRFEYYTSINGGLAAGTLGTTSTKAGGGKDVEENGYFLSVKHMVTDEFGVFGGLSKATISNPKKVSPPAESNGITRVGVDYKVEKNVTFFVDHAMFTTGYWVAADNKAKDQKGTHTMLGLMMKF